MLQIRTQPVPLQQDSDGNWRIGRSRILLEIVIDAFNNGRIPEEIVQSYDSLQLEDVYAVIAYYLGHRQEIDAYVQEQEREAETLELDFQKRPDYLSFRQRLLARRDFRS